MLGILFRVLGQQAVAMRDKEQETFFVTQSGRRKDRLKFTADMYEGADACLQICDQMDVGNILILSLMWKTNTLHSQIIGDTCKSSLFLACDPKCLSDPDDAVIKLWRRQGDKVHLATALGLHHCATRADAGVTTSREIERRIFSAMFFKR